VALNAPRYEGCLIAASYAWQWTHAYKKNPGTFVSGFFKAEANQHLLEAN